MKPLKLFCVSIATAASALLVTSPASAQSTRFACGTSQSGSPATMAQTPNGNVPVIRWVSSFGHAAGYTPQRRCQEVSARFQSYHEAGRLDYLTTGVMNNHPVICVADNVGGACNGLLFTLPPGRDANQTLEQLMGVRVGARDALNESAAGSAIVQRDARTGNIYVDMNAYIESAPTEGNTAVPDGDEPSSDSNGGGLW